MRATLALFQLSACCMYKTVLSIEYLSVLLTHGEVRCISEIFDKGAEVSVIVAAVSTSKNINAQFISLLARDHDEKVILDERIGISEIENVIDKQVVIKLYGNYKFCFDYLFLEGHHEKKPAKINFFFGIQNKKICQNGLLKIEKSRLDIIKASSDKLFEFEDSIGRIAAEFEFARKREIFLDETSRTTASNIKMMSAFSILILLIASLWQIFYLRHYFYLKKIL